LRLIADGRPWSSFLCTPMTAADSLAARIHNSVRRYRQIGPLAIDRNSIDEALILNRWIVKHWGHPLIREVDLASDDDWLKISQWALSVDPDLLEQWSPNEVGSEGCGDRQDEESLQPTDLPHLPLPVSIVDLHDRAASV
jgi:hypothetical protein